MGQPAYDTNAGFEVPHQQRTVPAEPAPSKSRAECIADAEVWQVEQALKEEAEKSANNVASDQRLDTSNKAVHDWHHPDDLPIAPLHNTSICRSDQMHADYVDESPEKSEAPD
ncbi:hypothetical protein H2203_006306 [Taxawa tesnikishii (nom. ined.)]|nr:hypothetical protein H2203_006306 [Dothideales sp. JES 119]